MEILRLASGDRRRLVSGRRWLLGLGVIALSIVGCGVSKPSTPVDGGSSGTGGAAGFGDGATAGQGGSVGSGGSTQAGAGGEPGGDGQAGAGGEPGGGGQAGVGGAGEAPTIVTGLQYNGAIRFVREVP